MIIGEHAKVIDDAHKTAIDLGNQKAAKDDPITILSADGHHIAVAVKKAEDGHEVIKSPLLRAGLGHRLVDSIEGISTRPDSGIIEIPGNENGTTVSFTCPRDYRLVTGKYSLGKLAGVSRYPGHEAFITTQAYGKFNL